MSNVKASATPYQRLSGKKSRFFGYDRLWLGPDHILHLRSHTFSEDYKRFYFKDIQALIVRKTAEGRIFNLICGIVIALCLLSAAALDSDIAFVFRVIAALFSLLLIINVFFGPTCACHIKTAVQTEKLPSLSRIRQARKVLSRIKPLIISAQGAFIPDSSVDPDRPTAIGDQTQPDRHRPVSRPKKESSTVTHGILFGLLLILGLFGWGEFYQQQVLLSLLSTACYMSAGITVIIALVRQGRMDMHSVLKTLTWITFGFLLVQFVISQIIGYTAIFRNPAVTRNQWELFEFLAAISPNDSPLLYYFHLFSVVIFFGLGCSGLIMAILSRPIKHGRSTAVTAAQNLAPRPAKE